MATQEARCAVVQVLIADHKYGTPLPKEEVVSRTAVEDDGEAKTAFEELKQQPFVRYGRQRGMMIDSSRFGDLADYLYYECGWKPFVIESRLKHYEGWEKHDWM